MSGLNIFPLRVDFPQTPVGFDDATPRANFNSDGPTVQTANFGSGNLTLVNQDVIKQLIVGFLTSNETPTLKRYGIYVGSKPYAYGSNQWPQFDRKIAAKSSDTYKISLRFSPPGADTYAVASDIYAAYVNANPSQLNWNDRRAIGALFLSSQYDGSNPKNPRGWFYNDPNVDVTTTAGRAALQQRILQYATDSIEVLRDADAQGVVTWDIEGQEYPHATSYIGDPRLGMNLAPEFDPIADEYFNRFKNAGFRVGLCIRPQQLKNSNGSVITSSTPKATISNPSQEDVAAIKQEMLAKIDYAKNRWNCTLFYVDSNVAGRNPADLIAYKEISAARPDILLMPEHSTFGYQAYSAPFYNLTNTNISNGDTFPSTPSDVRRTYPNAFSVIKIDDDPSKVDALRPQIVQAVREGDVLMFNAWYYSTEGQQLKDIYAEANPLRVTTTQDVVANDNQVSLREAITYANNHPGYDTITFAWNARGVIKLNGTPLPTVTGDCFITGPGGDATTIDGDGKSRILRISSGASVIVNGLVFANGKAPANDNNGGAFFNDGNLTITHCAVRDSTGFYGGGVFNNGTLYLVNSTFNGNTALDSGGGLVNLGAVTATNCTFSGNFTSASAGTGGAGINSYGSSATINLNFCTVTTNNGANATANARSGIWMEGGTLSIHNTIVYGNGTRDIQHDSGTVASAGYNLIGNKGSATGFLSTDKIGVNPLLGSLQYNGGPTMTHAIASGSPAINAGDPATNSGDTDQRGGGSPRVLNGRADIGAFESNFNAPSSGSS